MVTLYFVQMYIDLPCASATVTRLPLATARNKNDRNLKGIAHFSHVVIPLPTAFLSPVPRYVNSFPTWEKSLLFPLPPWGNASSDISIDIMCKNACWNHRSIDPESNVHRQKNKGGTAVTPAGFFPVCKTCWIRFNFKPFKILYPYMN